MTVMFLCMVAFFAHLERQPEKGKVIGHMPMIKKTWYLRFYINPYKVASSTYMSIALIAIPGPHNNQFGKRSPGLWFCPHSTRIRTHADVNNITSFLAETHEIPLNAFTKYESMQIKVGDDYHFIVKYNDTVKYETINTIPLSFKDMTVYSSDPWHEAAYATIKDFYLINL